MKYADMRAECEQSGAVKQEAGVDVCGFNRSVKCCGFSCPSKHYWSKGVQSHGKHKMAALERAGLVEQYEYEIEKTP